MARESTAMETMFTTRPQVAPGSGFPMEERVQHLVPKRLADVRYQRGMARPAAEVYLERLREMGVVSVGITADAEDSVRVAAAKVGIGVAASPSKPGRPSKAKAN